MENQIQEKQEENQESLSLSKKTIVYLHETSPWLKFFSIVGFIFSGITFLLSFFFLGSSGVSEKISDLNSGSGSSLITGIFLFIVYVGLAIVMYIPSKYLYTYAKTLKVLNQQSGNNDLEGAFYLQKKFWRFLGVLTIVYLAILIFIIPFIAGYISKA